MKIYFFTNLESFSSVLTIFSDVELVHCLSLEILEKMIGEDTEVMMKYLLSFGIGTIIPAAILDRFAKCINIHAASWEYPGRDPHHYAVYEGTTFYGAVAHFMEETVDSGAIIDTLTFDVLPTMNSMDLLKRANQCGLELAKNIIRKVSDQEDLIPIEVHWDPVKRKRSDFVSFTKISPDVSSQEMNKKYRAFQEGVPYNNLYLDVHGHRFRYERKLESNEDSSFTYNEDQS